GEILHFNTAAAEQRALLHTFAAGGAQGVIAQLGADTVFLQLLLQLAQGIGIGWALQFVHPQPQWWLLVLHIQKTLQVGRGPATAAGAFLQQRQPLRAYAVP